MGKWWRGDLRIGACGRECLGEWEWEEAYGRWRVAVGLDEADEEDEEEEMGEMGEVGGMGDGTGEGEILRAVCFEGF